MSSVRKNVVGILVSSVLCFKTVARKIQRNCSNKLKIIVVLLHTKTIVQLLQTIKKGQKESESL